MADVMIEALLSGESMLYQSTQLWYNSKQHREEEMALAFW